MAVSLAVLCSVTSGCNTRMLDFTIISSKNVNMPLPPSAKGVARVTGSDDVFAFIIPFGVPNLKAAVDRAIESAGPGYDALIDGVLYHTSGMFSVGFRVEGTPIKTSALKMALGNGSVLYHSSLGRSNAQGIEQMGITDAPLTTAEVSEPVKVKNP